VPKVPRVTCVLSAVLSQQLWASVRYTQARRVAYHVATYNHLLSSRWQMRALYALALSFCLSVCLFILFVCLFVCSSPVKFVKSFATWQHLAATTGKPGAYRINSDTPIVCCEATLCVNPSVAMAELPLLTLLHHLTPNAKKICCETIEKTAEKFKV